MGPTTIGSGACRKNRTHVTLMFAFAVGVGLLPSCGSNQMCTPGQQNACLCPDGKAGSQTCSGDGSGYGSCGPCCTQVEILCQGSCQTCDAGKLPYCDSAQGLVCCPADYPDFCDSQFAGESCGGLQGCYSHKAGSTWSCATATDCSSGVCHICQSGYTYNCSTAKCQQ
jgi:hypothetical protein